MLYREKPQMEKLKTPTVGTTSEECYNEEFVECLKNALKIMESRQPITPGDK